MAQLPNQASLDPLTGLPKDISHGVPSPPPAYCPPARHLRHQAATRRVAEDPSRATSAAQFSQLCNMNNANYDNNREYVNLDVPHDYDDERSPIELRICTTVQVEGDNNAILMTAPPADHAKAVVDAVTATIRQAGSMNDGGIPMIDEEGRPRPFRITVEAGMHIEGSGNVLGSEEHIKQLLGGKRKRDDGDGGRVVVAADKGSDDDASPQPRRLRRSSI
ncbi:hypothetical protein J7T55_007073 [Diaporthe amygdali]|uniref:uncharacterized protein n=1 Tax=Phomopsis amygdali TaxID=1214568 RepID=UPI0022FEA73E|nr:uncharacterized protein J7T55_007073 [Diaporthe amygdali]KAJ0107861.1 hypothetical protein J7T55_007073 [Diaporthe amygdali]